MSLQQMRVSNSLNLFIIEITMILFDTDGTTGFEVWLPSYNSRIDILDVLASGNFLQGSTIFCMDRIQVDNSPCSELSNNSKSIRSRSISREHKINMICCCIIEDCIWIGDTAGNIHSYRYVLHDTIFIST